MYGDSITNAVADYMLSNNGIIPEWNDIKDNIDKYYKGNKVECDITQINSDGAVYLSECKVNGKYVDYIYGKGTTTGCSAIKGDGTNFSDEIKCAGEEFYVIENDGTNIKMLAKYNLNVGENPYPEGKIGIQNKNANGNAALIFNNNFELENIDIEKPVYGAVQFSDTNYWGTVENGKYVYDSNSSIYKYIDEYNAYLKKNGINAVEMRLLDIGDVNISDEQLDNFAKLMLVDGFWLGNYFGNFSTGEGSGLDIILFNYLIPLQNLDFNNMSQEELTTLLSIYSKGFGVRPLVVVSKDQLTGTSGATSSACFDYIENVDNVTDYTINHDVCISYMNGVDLSSDDKEKLCSGQSTERYKSVLDVFNIFTREEIAELGIINLTGTPNGTISITKYKCGGEPKDGNLTQITNGEYMDVVIPSQIDGKRVTKIGASSFSTMKMLYGNTDIGKPIIKSIVIPGTVTIIGAYSFAGNQLTSIIIPDSVVSIGDDAFNNNKISSAKIGNNVKYIGSSAFIANQLTSITIPNSVTTIGSVAFSSNQLTDIKIPNNVTSVGWGAFSENSLTSIELGNGLKTIEDQVFKDNKLTSITIPSNVTNIGINAFYGNKLTSVKINTPQSQVTFESGSFGWAEGYSDSNIQWAS